MKDFKSVGEQADARKFQPQLNTIPVGIKTPLRLGTRADGIFAMNLNVADQIQDNFKNLLLTNHGDRVGLYDFGANLRDLTLEMSRDDFDTQAMVRIKNSINKYMPFIEPRGFISTIEPREANGLAKVSIRVVYDVPRLSIVGKAIEVVFVAGG